ILVGEAVMVLPPDMRCEQIIQGSYRAPPRQLPRDLEPLGVLVEHRIDDVDKGLIAREQAVASGQQIAFEPALAKMLAQHLHYAALPREMDVIGLDLLHPNTLSCLEDIVQAIGRGLGRTRQAEIATVRVQ